ncbi:MAG: hypothetical protein WDZ52_04870 [Pseudohongiellaceae bacterium]
MSKKSDKIEGTVEAWESGKLGNDEEHAKLAPIEAQKALDNATGLKPVSIRLPVSLIEELKVIADFNQIGYQPLIRKHLQRFASAELRAMAIRYHEEKKSEAEAKDESMLKAS